MRAVTLRASSHHDIVDCFPVTARREVFYSLGYETCMRTFKRPVFLYDVEGCISPHALVNVTPSPWSVISMGTVPLLSDPRKTFCGTQRKEMRLREKA